MIKFCKTFYSGISDQTFLESCGVADLITTCFGGRNRKCADAYAKAGGKRPLEDIEKELLGGQKLQGTLTAKEVNQVLKMKGLEHEFPLFTAVFKISYEGQAPDTITSIDASMKQAPGYAKLHNDCIAIDRPGQGYAKLHNVPVAAKKLAQGFISDPEELEKVMGA